MISYRTLGIYKNFNSNHCLFKLENCFDLTSEAIVISFLKKNCYTIFISEVKYSLCFEALFISYFNRSLHIGSCKQKRNSRLFYSLCKQLKVTHEC